MTSYDESFLGNIIYLSTIRLYLVMYCVTSYYEVFIR